MLIRSKGSASVFQGRSLTVSSSVHGGWGGGFLLREAVSDVWGVWGVITISRQKFLRELSLCKFSHSMKKEVRNGFRFFSELGTFTG